MLDGILQERDGTRQRVDVLVSLEASGKHHNPRNASTSGSGCEAFMSWLVTVLKCTLCNSDSSGFERYALAVSNRFELIEYPAMREMNNLSNVKEIPDSLSLIRYKT